MLPRFSVQCLMLALLAPSGSAFSQRAAARAPQFPVLARFDDLAPGNSGTISPDGRFLLNGKDSISLYVIKTGRSVKIADGPGESFTWSTRMNRLAWVRGSDGPNGGSAQYVWSMPMDSSTGQPRGVPQRVSSGPGHFPAPSADGARIAYVTDDRRVAGRAPNSPAHRLVVVNANGGPEQVLARSFDGLDTPWWSRDGQSIYVAGTLADSTRAAVHKIFLDGRPSQVIRKGEREWFAGMTPDRLRIITVPTGQPVAPGARAVVMDTTGKQLWTVPLPEGATAIYDGPLSNNTLVWVNDTRSTTLVVRALEGGALRRIPLVGESNGQPQWSPDGKRIAFLIRSGLSHDLAVMNADGSNVQRFTGTNVRNDAFAFRWSPDNRLIGFVSRGSRAFRTVEPATRIIRTVLTDSTKTFGVFEWRSSSASVLIFLAGQQGVASNAYEELALNGTLRRLVAIPDLPGASPSRTAVLMPDGSLIVRSDSGVFTVSRNATTPRKLESIALPGQSTALAISYDQQWLARGVRGPSMPTGQLELTSLSTGERRVSTLPFWFLSPILPQFTPDGSGVLLTGRQLSDSIGTNLYLAPTSGAPARFIANLGFAAGFSLSPDGKTLVHTVHHKATQTLLSVDLRNPNR